MRSCKKYLLLLTNTTYNNLIRSDDGLILWQGKREKIVEDEDEYGLAFDSEEDQFDANFFALGSKFLEWQPCQFLYCLVIVSMAIVLPTLLKTIICLSFTVEVSQLSFPIQLSIPYFKK